MYRLFCEPRAPIATHCRRHFPTLQWDVETASWAAYVDASSSDPALFQRDRRLTACSLPGTKYRYIILPESFRYSHLNLCVAPLRRSLHLPSAASFLCCAAMHPRPHADSPTATPASLDQQPPASPPATTAPDRPDRSVPATGTGPAARADNASPGEQSPPRRKLRVALIMLALGVRPMRKSFAWLLALD